MILVAKLPEIPSQLQPWRCVYVQLAMVREAEVREAEVRMSAG